MDFNIPGKLVSAGIRGKTSNAERFAQGVPTLAPGGGIVPATNSSIAIAPSFDDPARSEDRSPLVDYLPQFSTIEAWFDGALTFPAPFALGTGESAWFGLQSIRIPTSTGQDVSLYQIDPDILPTDSDGTGGGSSVAWGTTKGSGAAIVVGTDLGITLGEWTGGPGSIPRVETSGGGILTDSGGKFSRNVRVLGFPSGKYTDTVPQRNNKSISFAPGAWRFSRGSTLDVALVVRSGQAAGVGVRKIYGSAYVALTVFRTKSRSDFSQ